MLSRGGVSKSFETVCGAEKTKIVKQLLSCMACLLLPSPVSLQLFLYLILLIFSQPILPRSCAQSGSGPENNPWSSSLSSHPVFQYHLHADSKSESPVCTSSYTPYICLSVRQLLVWPFGSPLSLQPISKRFFPLSNHTHCLIVQAKIPLGSSFSQQSSLPLLLKYKKILSFFHLH